MKILQFAFSAKGDKPLYLRFAEGLRAAIRKGFVLPGETLPSTREFARSFRIHRHTVMAALDELVAEGWLAVSPRKGYRVSDQLPSRFAEANSQRKVQGKEVKRDWRL